MKKLALAFISAGLLALPASASAIITVSSDRTLNCSSGAGAPAGFTFGNNGFTVAEDLIVASGATLSLTGSSSSAPPCALRVNGSVTAAGTIEYDQKSPIEKGGALEIISNDAIDVPGRITANGRPGLSRTSAAPGDGTSGTDAGSVVLRAPRLVTVNGAVEANGGTGGTGAVAAPPSGSANGGNGGDAGSIVIFADFGTINVGGSLAANAGKGGGNAGSGVNGDAGSETGLVRRNALAIAGAGPIAAASKQVNLPPTNLAPTATPAAGQRPSFTWTDNSTEETSFVLLRSNGGRFAAVAATGPNAKTISDPSAIQAGPTYRYLLVPVFPPAVWPNALIASNLVELRSSGTIGGSSPGVGTVSPTTPRTGAFSVNRSTLRSRYSLPRSRRGLRLAVRTTGTGRLRVSLRVRTSSGNRTARRTVSVRRGTNRFTLNLPRRWRAGRYTLRLTTVGLNGSTRTASKRISIRYRR